MIAAIVRTNEVEEAVVVSPSLPPLKHKSSVTMNVVVVVVVAAAAASAVVVARMDSVLLALKTMSRTE